MLPASEKKLSILMADDDHDDCQVVRDAFQESGLPHRIHCVHNGEELLDYLLCQGAYASRQPAHPPDLVLLDLNMPKKDGREALRHMKNDPQLKPIPVVVLTTSTSKDDIGYSYTQGASSYITKPTSFRNWVHFATTLSEYWGKLARLPLRG